MLYDINKEKIRCYVIADDYRWHLVTDDINQFLQSTLAYVKLMNESKKENHYYFKNIFLERAEYEQIVKNLSFQAAQKNEAPPATPPKRERPAHLQLVVSNP